MGNESKKEKARSLLYQQPVSMAISPEEKADIFSAKKRRTESHSVYGEISREAIENMFEVFPAQFNDPNGHFVDLGSGRSKFPMLVALSTTIGKCTGIELSPTRHTMATTLLSEIEPELFEDTEVELVNGSFYESTAVATATIAYVDNTMYIEEASKRDFAKKLFSRLPVGCLVIHKTPLMPPENHARARYQEENETFRWNGIPLPEGVLPITTTYNSNSENRRVVIDTFDAANIDNISLRAQGFFTVKKEE